MQAIVRFTTVLALVAGCSLPPESAQGTRSDAIVGGHDVHPQAYPWVAALYNGPPDSAESTCSGAFIDDTHVIAPAACLMFGIPEQNEMGFMISYPEWTFVQQRPADPDEVDPDSLLAVASIRVHPDFEWNAFSARTDIAVL